MQSMQSQIVRRVSRQILRQQRRTAQDRQRAAASAFSSSNQPETMGVSKSATRNLSHFSASEVSVNIPKTVSSSNVSSAPNLISGLQISSESVDDDGG